MIRCLLMLIILSTGCSRPTKPLDPLAADTIMAPAYPRSTMGDAPTERVATELATLTKNRQTPAGEILFDRCDVLPPFAPSCLMERDNTSNKPACRLF